MKKWSVLSLLAAALFIIVIDTTVMNVSISALVEDLDATVSGVQSAVSVYALVMASFIMIGGKLGDIIGKRRTFITGLIIFGIGTGIASFSQSLGGLILGWSVLEGLGSALMLPNIQTLLRDQYEGKSRATAYGAIGAVAAIGAAVGPIVGGALTTYATWRWAFRVEVLIVVIVLIFVGRIRKDVAPERRPGFDYLGGVVNVLGWTFIVLGVLMGSQYGLFIAKKPFVVGQAAFAPIGLSVVPFMIAAGVLLIVLLVNWERRMERKGKDGLFKPSLLDTAGLRSGFGVRLAQMAITAAFLFTFPLLLQLSFQYTAVETGLALLPFSIALLVTALLGARLSGLLPAKRIIQIGYIIAIAGLVAIAISIQPVPTPADIATGAALGAGLGLITSQILNLILSAVPAQHTAETAGLNGTFEQLGNAFGVAVLGTIMLFVLGGNLERGVVASDTIPPDEEATLIGAIERGVNLVSNAQVEEGLAAAGIDDVVADEVLQVYGHARTDAFKVGAAFLAFLACAGLVLTAGLPNTKLVQDQDAGGQRGGGREETKEMQDARPPGGS